MSSIRPFPVTGRNTVSWLSTDRCRGDFLGRELLPDSVYTHISIWCVKRFHVRQAIIPQTVDGPSYRGCSGREPRSAVDISPPAPAVGSVVAAEDDLGAPAIILRAGISNHFDIPMDTEMTKSHWIGVCHKERRCVSVQSSLTTRQSAFVIQPHAE